MTLAVTVLGSSGMFSTLERASSGYLLEIDDNYVCLDAGGGTYRNLLRHVSFADLAGFILTHRHPDHTIDLFQTFHSRRYGSKEPLPTIPLWAPAETLERLTAFIPDLTEAFDPIQIAAGEAVDVFGAKASFTHMAHPPETVGVRIEHGGVLAYSADTGGEADFHELAGAADLFICEATLQDADELWEGHLRASQAGRIAAEAGVKKLLLSHLPPGRDHSLSLQEATTAGAPDPLLAEDNTRMEVS